MSCSTTQFIPNKVLVLTTQAVLLILYLVASPSTFPEKYIVRGGPGSSVSIATGYGLDGPRIESRWGGENLRTRPDRPWIQFSLL